ncbi:hypothetical protein, partial [Paenibacillus sp. y28]|uniref:hypothetical protein n=1 Tax=Paenibacillus sp. y28 TaxID=3129110 RepID=UPI00301A27FC
SDFYSFSLSVRRRLRKNLVQQALFRQRPFPVFHLGAAVFLAIVNGFSHFPLVHALLGRCLHTM